MVVFVVRFQEISCALEKSLTMCALDPVSHGSEFRLNIHACESLVACVKQCWSDDVYLPPLVHRFAKLTSQLVSRFCTWSRSISNKPVMVVHISTSDVAIVSGTPCFIFLLIPSCRFVTNRKTKPKATVITTTEETVFRRTSAPLICLLTLRWPVSRETRLL